MNEFISLKQDGMGTGAQAFARWLAMPKTVRYTTGPDFGVVQIRYYWNNFVSGRANNTNDLSLAVFVQFGAFKMLFAGDLESSGWEELLESPSFRQDLIGTNILVASHHGRENGCHAALFDWFRPEITIISDDYRQYDSQNTDAWYRSRCVGASYIVDPSQRRYVLTTRKDGSMIIETQLDGRWTLWPVKVSDWPRETRLAPNKDFNALAYLDPRNRLLPPPLLH